MPRIPANRRSAVIVTALDVETQAVLRHLTKRAERTIDGTVFYLGRFEDWNIAVVESGAGNNSAAAISERAIANFRPSVALFVGIAGGVKDVAIGDVVVAEKIHGYESGKDEKEGFRPRPSGKDVSHDIEQRGRALPKSAAWLKRLNGELGHKSPKVIVGPIAAGEKVVASTESATAEFLRKEYGDTLAVEMEGRGFLEGVGINALVLGGVVRGISDLLSGKSEADKGGSQPRAADAASAAAFEILHAIPKPERNRVRKPAKSPRTSKPAKRKSAVAIPASPVAQKPAFLEMPTTFSKAAYFEQGEVLAKIGVSNVDEIQFSYVDPPHAYLRIIPTTALGSPLSVAALREAAGLVPLLKSRRGAITTINRYGGIAYDPAGTYPGGPAPLHWSTQLFQNGELWALSNTMVIRERGSRPQWMPLPLLPATLFEQLYYEVAHMAVSIAQGHLGLTFPCQLELGLINIRGMHIGITTEDIRGPVQVEEAVCRVTLESYSVQAVDDALLAFFNHVHDLTGYRRPENLHGFPPNRPHG
jgi:nucleoside phosphorylase